MLMTGAKIEGRRIWIVLAFAACALGLHTPISAQIMDYNRWKIDVTPYFWLAGTTGDLVLNGEPHPIDVTFKELSDFASWGISGHVEARKQLWAFIADVRYRDLDSQEEQGSTDLKSTLFEVSAAFTFFRSFEYPVTFDVLAGLRYFNTRWSIRDAASEPSGEENWVDPIIGGRTAWKPGEAWTLSLRGDIGGFGAGSSFSWNAAAVAAYRVYGFSFILGYRAWNADYESGSGTELFKYDLTTHGPGIGFTFHFGGGS